MDTDDLKYIKERQEAQSRMFSDDRDRYNTLDAQDNEDLYNSVIKEGDIRKLPISGQKWESYLIEMKIHLANACRKNFHVHVVKGVRGHPWYTHTRGDGCFMCEDINLMHLMYHTMVLMLEQHQEDIF